MQETEQFAAWHYGGLHPIPGDPLAAGDLTTTEGIGIGSTIPEVLTVGGGFSGGYDAAYFASLWHLGDSVAGELDRDATSLSARVTSITAGIDRAPAREVC